MSEVTRTAMLADGDTLLTLHKYEVEATGPDGTVTRFEFGQRLVVLGSHPDADVPIDDPQVSRYHCQIEADPSGYRLRDLGSKNGTFVSGLKVNDVYLHGATQWQIGSHKLKLHVSDKTVEIRLSGQDRFQGMLGRSVAMREVFGVLARVAATNVTVLIEGESGTGKELAARAVHKTSARKNGPFIVFDCSAIPKDLVESELFGHMRGAFTGAVADRKGAFEQASGGTLFLDELGELALDLQPKLLRALDSGRIRRVGGTNEIQCDTRIVAATNRNLKREVSEGTFREDLYYRLAVIQVQLPPLRKRAEDIPLLAETFLAELAKNVGQGALQVSFSTMEKLKKHKWPGNVRELRNFIERAAVLADGDRVETKFLKLGHEETKTEAKAGDRLGDYEWADELPFKDAKSRLVESFEKAYWSRLLERTAGNVSKAARVAGVHRKSVEYILKKLELGRDAASKEEP